MKFVLSFAASEFVNFRQIEYLSLCQLCGISSDLSISEWSRNYWSQPYIVVDLQSESAAVNLVERSVLIKAVYEVWCEATDISDLQAKIPKIPAQLTNKYLNSGGSYKLIISSVNRKLQHEEKLEIIENVLNAHPSVNATVCLKNPNQQLNVLLDYEPRNWGKRPLTSQVNLRHVYYGRLVGTSRRRDLINSYRLADRAYLGNTSMDVRLAGIMANAGLCEQGSLVWDPFLGTGSIVLAASIWGALGAGSDIDYALLHGMGMSPKAGQGQRMNGECLRVNYQQYNLQSRYLDVVVADAASLGRLLRLPGENKRANGYSTVICNMGLFDAILTDPPYGFRESSRRVAGQAVERSPSLVTPERLSEITGVPLRDVVQTNSDEQALIKVPHDLPHIPHKESYPLTETYNDLLNLAVHFLKPGGRLVFWIPVNRLISCGPCVVPSHARLQVLAVCEQILNVRNARYMIVMRKLYPEELDEVASCGPDRFYSADLAY
ncbi:tRNA guanosine 2' O methyltransferase TRM11 [Paragonimus westermani]|uniref:tRNA (guanine(10)-N(2))-methyltransferase n=1 Tax=Paragonimus westermani TaxID=34504 RepID=A0A8T0D9X4_9TREM|nr:tRNA guanosine 2' O methyltransferase TRM11 [Paragonimus westermani]